MELFITIPNRVTSEKITRRMWKEYVILDHGKRWKDELNKYVE